MLGLKEIQEILPQRYPFLLIDKVIEYEKDKSLTAIKNITGNEWAIKRNDQKTGFFPEVLMVEAAAQAAIILYDLTKNNPGEEKPVYFLGKMSVDIEGEIKSGDQLIAKAYPDKLLRSGGFARVLLYKEVKQIADINIFFSVKR